MPNTAEHRAAMHALATERRRARRPAWAYEITDFGSTLADLDVDNPDDDNLRDVRNRLVALIRSSRWYKVEAADEYSELHETVDELADVADPDIFSPAEAPDYDPVRHFTAVLDSLYDLADYQRCWLAPN